MEHMEPRLQLFWVIHLIALGIFGLEFLFVLSVRLHRLLPDRAESAEPAV